MSEYYAQLDHPTDTSQKWEKVDEYVFNNWANALKDDLPRYNGKRISINDDGILLFGVFEKNDLSVAMRILDIKVETGCAVNGFYAKPELIRFASKSGKSHLLHEVGGETFSVLSKRTAKAG